MSDWASLNSISFLRASKRCSQEKRGHSKPATQGYLHWFGTSLWIYTSRWRGFLFLGEQPRRDAPSRLLSRHHEASPAPPLSTEEVEIGGWSRSLTICRMVKKTQLVLASPASSFDSRCRSAGAMRVLPSIPRTAHTGLLCGGREIDGAPLAKIQP